MTLLEGITLGLAGLGALGTLVGGAYALKLRGKAVDTGKDLRR